MALITNLVSYWKCDENAANTTVADSEGSNTGVSSGNTSTLYNASGKINSTFEYDGSEDVVIADDATLDPNNITVSCWIYLTAATTNGGIVGKAGATPVYLLSQFTDPNIIRFHLTSSAYQYVDSGEISLNAWHHVVGTYDGTTQSIYLDGGTPATKAVVSGNLITSANDLKFGIDTSNTFYTTGRIDEVGLWSRALTSTEVSELYNSGDGFAYPFTTGTNMKINIGDTFKDVDSMQINIGDTWKDVSSIQQNIGDSWKTVF